MESIWLGISPGPLSTRLLAMRGPKEVILKAELLRSPASPRAVQALMESLALWEGLQVRGVLVADDHPSSCDTTLYRDVFPDHGSTPLYTLDWVPRGHRRRRRDVLTGMGEFRDLEHLLCSEVAR
jgi:hypothetical protein